MNFLLKKKNVQKNKTILNKDLHPRTGPKISLSLRTTQPVEKNHSVYRARDCGTPHLIMLSLRKLCLRKDCIGHMDIDLGCYYIRNWAVGLVLATAHNSPGCFLCWSLVDASRYTTFLFIWLAIGSFGSKELCN